MLLGTTVLAAAGIEEGRCQWSLMLPTTIRVTKIVYKSSVGAFYPRAARRTAEGARSFDARTRSFVMNLMASSWCDARKRESKRDGRSSLKQRMQETLAAVLAAFSAAHEMREHIQSTSRTKQVSPQDKC